MENDDGGFAMIFLKEIRKGHSKESEYGHEVRTTIPVYILQDWSRMGVEITLADGKIYRKDEDRS